MAFRVNYKRFEKRKMVCGDGSRAKQQFRDECNINNIMKKFQTTGVLPNMIKSNPQYGDFTDVPDYQAALDIVRHAEEQFMALSAQVRKRFGNNPEEFLAFATDPRNGEEMVKMGLATKKAPTAPDNAVPAPKKRTKTVTPDVVDEGEPDES